MNIQGSVFIVTYGRSGSTLLQGILNSIEGYHIRGENLNALVPLFKSYKRIRRSRFEFGKDRLNEKNPWYGADGLDHVTYGAALAETFISQVLRPMPGTTVTGFKEIRYGGMDFAKVEEAVEYLQFIRDSFPRARFIFNERNIDDVIDSAWWKGRSDARDTVKELLNRMQLMYEPHKDVSMWVNYDDYVNNVANLQPLFHFLEEPFDKERILNLMAKKHSY